MMPGRKPYMFPLFCALLISAFAVRPGAVIAQTADQPEEGPAAIDVQADSYEFDTESGWATGSGNVTITYHDMVLEADRVRVNMQTKDVEAHGDIYFYRLQQPDAAAERGVYWRGTTLTGNFETGVFEAGEHKVMAGEWYEKGGKAVYKRTGEIIFHNVTVSTCEYLHDDKAHYSLSAKRVVYTANGRLRAWNTVYRVGRIPVLYWPYVYWGTEQDSGNISIEPGYDDDWGAFLLLGREWAIGERGKTEFSVELRSERGIALRNRTRFFTDTSATDILLYGMRDQEPPETDSGYNRRFDVEDDRYRVKLYHQQQWWDSLSLRLNLDVLSDIDMLEEWFESEFDNYPQPRTYGDLRLDHERFTLSLSARARVNDFYSVVERLPELKIELPRQTTFIPGLLYEGKTSLANLEMSWRDFDRDPIGGGETPDDYESWRFDSLHMFYYPINLAGMLQIIPRAGIRATYYDETSDTEVTAADWSDFALADDPDLVTAPAALNQYDDDGGSAWRLTGELGLELSSKMTRTWNTARSDFWHIDGLRHVVQPYINYTYIPAPGEERENLYFFDPIDRLTELNFVRAGVTQRLQTRDAEAGSIYTLASLETYADFHFTTPYEHETFGQFGTRFSLRPKPDLAVWGSLVAAMDDGRIRWSELGAEIKTVMEARIALSYLYRDDYRPDSLITMGTTLTDLGTEDLAVIDTVKSHYVTLSLNVPIGSKMQGSARYEYDFVEDELARQIYQLSRDLHCWVGALQLEEDDGVITAKVILYLKAFPQVGAAAGI